jgi:hypothetical protein
MNTLTALHDEVAKLTDYSDPALRLAASTGLRAEQRERLAWLQDKQHSSLGTYH